MSSHTPQPTWPPKRPRLKPGIKLFRRPAAQPRGEATHDVQIGLDPARRIAICGVKPELITLMNALDGHQTWTQIQPTLRQQRIDPAQWHELLAQLWHLGVLDDASLDQVASSPTGKGEITPNIRGEIQATNLLFPEPGIGAKIVNRRRQWHIALDGTGPTAQHVSALLHLSGFPAPKQYSDTIGRKTRLNFLIHLRHYPLDAPIPLPDAADKLLATGLPVLIAGVSQTSFMVGPLILSGQSACIRCLHHHWTGRDSAWPQVLAQAVTDLSTEAPPQTTPAALSALAAALITTEVLNYSAGHLTLSLNGCLTAKLPFGLMQPLALPPHPYCDCGASAFT